jgi:hypothetical protein
VCVYVCVCVCMCVRVCICMSVIPCTEGSVVAAHLSRDVLERVEEIRADHAYLQ